VILGETGDPMSLIARAILYDLLGSKALASLSFIKDDITEDFIATVVNEYHALIQEDAARSFIVTDVHGRPASISRVSDMTLVIAVSESETFTDEEIARLQEFQKVVSSEITVKSVRHFKYEFSAVADAHLRTPLDICFVTAAEHSDDNKSVIAVESLLEIRQHTGEQFSEVMKIGPYAVRATRAIYPELVKDTWPDVMKSVGLFALVISKGMTKSDMIRDAVFKIRKASSARIIVIPGSDDDLEAAREFEIQHGVDLCDTVSPRPINLLLSAMAYGGFCDMQPELALQKWEIESMIREPNAPQEVPTADVGHKAFFVVDRRTGEAVYSYYYDERSGLLEVAPNIVAAISSFKIDQTGPTETSVFRTGDLSYITIERSDYVFTLITGSEANVEALRSRFSFLPDLFLDEIPKPSEDPTDLFRSPLFTIKLLATLPPAVLPGRVAPTQKRPLVWERFEHAPVREFLEAVWYRLNGTLTISKLAPGRGPELILGAIHLLNRLGAIDCQLRVQPDDIPSLVVIPDKDVMSLYEGLSTILALVDGSLGIQDIAHTLGLQPSVLQKVFAELHRRGIISLTAK